MKTRKTQKVQKELGQHFLKSRLVVNSIILAGGVNTSDTVLEIGPGKGILTRALLKHAKKVIAIEKDRELYDYLKILFEEDIKNGKLLLINDDILDILNMSPIIKTKIDDLILGKYKIIANIPYNITGALFKTIFLQDNLPQKVVFMVQKQVAERIVARNTRSVGSRRESLLSLSIIAYGNAKIIQKVPAKLFSPPPKVDSAVILIDDISRKFFNDSDIRDGTQHDEKRFFTLLKSGFAHKRKKLATNLMQIFGDKKIIDNIFNECDITSNTRAEQLTLNQWRCMNMRCVKRLLNKD